MNLPHLTPSIIAVSLFFSAPIFSAQSGMVTFMGTIAVATCNKSIVSSHSAKPTNQIQLKYSDATGSSTPVRFTITAQGINGGKCLAPEIAEVFWSSPKMSYRGLENLSGTAEGSYLSLISASRNGKTQSIDKIHNRIVYPKDELIDEGMNFYVVRHGDEANNNMKTLASFGVVYH